LKEKKVFEKRKEKEEEEEEEERSVFPYR
jgi:hypothetical protein